MSSGALFPLKNCPTEAGFIAFNVSPYSQDKPKRIFQQHVFRSEANWSLPTQEAWPSELSSYLLAFSIKIRSQPMAFRCFQ